LLRIEMLPAGQGDCLWIEYGDPARPHRILVDGGTPATAPRLRRRIEALAEGDRTFELLIVSHIDDDHIGGALRLLDDPPPGLAIGDVWFNGFRHLPEPADVLGVKQGEELSRALTGGRFPWNEAFGGGAVVVPEAGPLPRVVLPGGLELTLLSPGPRQLAALQPRWERELAKLRRQQAPPAQEEPGDLLGEGLDVAALAAAPFAEDDAVANGSSLAVLARFEGRAVLLAADAFPGVLAGAVDRLLLESGDDRLRLAACKVSHHGSRGNTSRALLERLDCRHYLVSTDGRRHHHPDREGIARLLAYGGREKILGFNYRTPHNTVWDDPDLARRWRYEVRYGAPGLALDLG
jgi:beta-lactamase superfamily II metal-dependent hydrolase